MAKKRRLIIAVSVVVVVIVVASVAYLETGNPSSTPKGSGPRSGAQLVTVSGNKLLNRQGKPTRLVGVDIGGSQYYCLQKRSTPFPAPINSATVSSLLSWHVNAVRVLVNDYCWLGVGGEPRSTSSAVYRKSVESFVSMLNAANIEVILAMTQETSGTSVPGNATSKKSPGSTVAPMAEAATASAFWRSVASTFASSPGVMFDLYNEPENISWSCWENGCKVKGIQVVGMQQLVDTVRSTGARQPLLLGGVEWSNSLTGWLAHEPTDPDHQLIASIHVYQRLHCSTFQCWNGPVARTAKKVPVIAGEFGDNNCSTGFTAKFMKWADSHSVSYLAWSWLTGGGCGNGGTLLSSFPGTATKYGKAYERHLKKLYKSDPATFELNGIPN
jgi:endoglucanase